MASIDQKCVSAYRLVVKKTQKHAHVDIRTLPEPRQPPCPYVLQVLLEVARSILHLHSMQLLHCDVKAENVLLKGNPSSPTGFTCKVRQSPHKYSHSLWALARNLPTSVYVDEVAAVLGISFM